MYKVIREVATKKLSIVKKTFNTPLGFIEMFTGKKSACKAWIAENA